MTVGEKIIELVKEIKQSTGLCELDSAMEELSDYLSQNPSASVLEVELIEKLVEFIDEERIRIANDEELEEEDFEEEEEEDWGDAWS